MRTHLHTRTGALDCKPVALLSLATTMTEASFCSSTSSTHSHHSRISHTMRTSTAAASLTVAFPPHPRGLHNSAIAYDSSYFTAMAAGSCLHTTTHARTHVLDSVAAPSSFSAPPLVFCCTHSRHFACRHRRQVAARSRCFQGRAFACSKGSMAL